LEVWHKVKRNFICPDNDVYISTDLHGMRIIVCMMYTCTYTRNIVLILANGFSSIFSPKYLLYRFDVSLETKKCSVIDTIKHIKYNYEWSQLYEIIWVLFSENTLLRDCSVLLSYWEYSVNHKLDTNCSYKFVKIGKIPTFYKTKKLV